MRFIKLFSLLLLFILVALFLFLYKVSYRFTDEKFGAKYVVKYRASMVFAFYNNHFIQEDIISELVGVEKTFMRNKPFSEISFFNKNRDVEIRVSPEFYSVLSFGSKLYEVSQGAWDPSAFPLLKLTKENKVSPNFEQLEQAKKSVGYNNIIILNDNFVRKQLPDLQVDFSSILSGHIVDKIAHALDSYGVKNYMVHYETVSLAKGKGKSIKGWKVETGYPLIVSGDAKVHTSIYLQNSAMSSLRITQSNNDPRYIDPRNGCQVSSNIFQINVVAPSGKISQGMACALLIMGNKDGLASLTRLKGVEAIILNSKIDGMFYSKSAGFPLD